MNFAEETMSVFENYLTKFINNTKYIDYSKHEKNFAINLYFVEAFTKEIEIGDFTNVNEVIKEFTEKFAKLEAYSMYGESLTIDEITKINPNIKKYLKNPSINSDKDLEGFKNLVLKFTKFCYENVYKAKYFNEYIINVKGDQFYLKDNIAQKPVVAFDLDGTLVNSNKRIAIMEEKKQAITNMSNKKTKDKAKKEIMNEFHSDTSLDEPYEHMVKIIELFRKEGFEIMILTARPDEHKEENLKFLKKWNIDIDIYQGRPVGNGELDHVGKYTWLNTAVAKERVKMFFEDRGSIIDYFKKKDIVNIYDVKELHKNPSNKNLASIVRDAKKRINPMESFFLLREEKENYKNFYKKADEYYQKRIGQSYAELEKTNKVRPNISY